MRAPLAFHWILCSGWAAMAPPRRRAPRAWPRPASRAARRSASSVDALGLRPRPSTACTLASSAARSPTTRASRRLLAQLGQRRRPASLAARSVCVTRCSSSSAERQQLVVLAGEVGQRLVGGGARVGADLALAVGRAHEDRAVLGHPAELRGPVAAGGVQTGQRGRAGTAGLGAAGPGTAGRGVGGAGAAAGAAAVGAASGAVCSSGRASCCSMDGVCSDTRSGLLLGDSNLEDADRLVGRRVAGLVGRLGARGGDLVHDIHAAGDPAEDGVAGRVLAAWSACRR